MAVAQEPLPQRVSHGIFFVVVVDVDDVVVFEVINVVAVRLRVLVRVVRGDFVVR